MVRRLLWSETKCTGTAISEQRKYESLSIPFSPWWHAPIAVREAAETFLDNMLVVVGKKKRTLPYAS